MYTSSCTVCEDRAVFSFPHPHFPVLTSLFLPFLKKKTGGEVSFSKKNDTGVGAFLYLCDDFTQKPIMSKNNIRKKEKKPFILSKGISVGISIAVTVIVAAMGAYYLIVENSDMLFMAQTQSYFTTNRIFLEECMHQPGGLISWAASFLTQFFYYPALGSTIMIAIWIVSMWLSKLAFKVKTVWMSVLALPVMCLLASMIDTGYWLYYLKQTGYWFYGTVGYLVCMLLLLFHSLFKKPMDRIITTILIAVTYPFFGWYTLLAQLYIAFISIANSIKSSKKVVETEESDGKKEKSLAYKISRPLIPFVLIAVIPLICYQLYPDIRLDDVWRIGLPEFSNNDLISFYPTLPFVVLSIIPIIFPFLPQKQEMKGWMAWTVCLISIGLLVASWVWVEKRNYQNYNYHAEMRMYRAAEEQDWEKVLEEMSNLPGDASRQMVLTKNVALINTGQIGDKMFKYNNMGERPDNGFDTLHVHIVQTAGSQLYYYHGKTNFASRWCIENSVEFGYDFDNLKILSRCALVNGEMDVAKKYLNILKTSLFYRDWAERLLPITEKPELIQKYHEFDKVRELYNHMGTTLDGDNGLVEMYLLNYFSNTMNKDSKLLQEVTLLYALVQKDIKVFWPRFFLYAKLHDGEKMPVHYQEAALLYGKLEPQTMNIEGMPFDEKVTERYEGFQQLSQSLLSTGMKPKEVGEAMKETYGDTFFWFYFFCRDLYTY